MHTPVPFFNWSFRGPSRIIIFHEVFVRQRLLRLNPQILDPEENMSILLWPVKLLGLAATGVVLGAGWKLGSYLVDSAMANKDKWFEDAKACMKACSEPEAPPETETKI
jgi:hypothetical protein